MRTRMWHSTLAILAMTSALVSCGDSSEPDQQSGTTPPPPVLGGDTTSGGDEALHTLDYEEEAADPSLRDSTPHEAFSTFLTRLQAYDIDGATKVCDPSDPNTDEVIRIAFNLSVASADSGMSVETLAGFMLEGIQDVTFEITEEGDESATVSVTTSEQNIKTYEVVRVDGAWRVRVPSRSYFPNK